MRIVSTTKRITITLLLGLFLAQTALASLGLGEARVQSFLGQNLDVEVTLVHSGESSLESLEVAVASLEDHARLGIPSDALALGLDVVLDRSVSPPIIRLRSMRPVESPFVQVLVDARWSSGRILREYTLFIDPPAVPVAPPILRTVETLDAEPEPETPGAAEPASTAQPAQPSSETLAERDQEEPPASAEPTAQPPSESEPRVVESGETLWSIASSWRPESSLSMHQAMLAIFDANPAAFMDDNINRLRRGARLVLPTAADARAIPSGEATRRFLEQTRAWESAQAIAAPVSSEPSAEVPAPEPTPEPEPESIVEDTDPAEADADPADSLDQDRMAEEEPAAAGLEESMDPEAAQPRLELTPPDEDVEAEMAALASERERLTDRLESLESEIARDGLATPEIDSLVDQARQAIDSADVGGMMVASEDLARLEEQLREARQARASESVPEITEPEAAQPEVVEPEPTAASSSPTLVERWLGPALGGVGALLLITALLVLRRRRAAAAGAGEDPETTGAGGSEPAAPVADDDAVDRPEAEDAEAALMGILGRDEDDEEQGEKDDKQIELDEGTGSSRDRTSLATEGFVPEAADDHAPDLAELSNRLESEDATTDEASTPSSPETLDLDDEDFDALFASDEGNESDTDAVPEDSEPLALDFEMPEREPEQEGDELGGSDEFDAETSAEAAAGQAGETPPAKADESVSESAGMDDNGESSDFDDFDFGEATSEASIAPESTEGVDSTDEFSHFSLDDSEDAQAKSSQESDDQAQASEDKAWFGLGDEDPLAESQPTDVEATTDEGQFDGDDELAGEPGAELSDEDAEVKLDLARAYISMEDGGSARSLLEEVINDGSSSHQEQARKLLDSLK